MAYLHVQEPADASLLTSFFQAQDADEHKCKEEEVRGEAGEDAGHGVPCMLYRTTISSPPSGSDHG
jgi:hypothetical protein